jgi:hypothetical protein
LLNKHSTIHGNQLIKETDNAVGVTTRPRYDLILINKNKNYKVSTTTSTTSLIPQDKSPSQSNKRQTSSSMGVQGSSPSQPSIWQPTAIPGVVERSGFTQGTFQGFFSVQFLVLT